MSRVKKFLAIFLPVLLLLAVIIVQLSLAMPTTIYDTTADSATNDGTINDAEYVGCSEGINAGFGNVIGDGSQLCVDSSTTGALNFGLIKGPGNWTDGNAVVIYIDSVDGGYASTANFTDTSDGLRSAISGKAGDNASVMTFAPGFEADFAIAMFATNDGQNPGFGGLWTLQENDEHTFVQSVNLTPAGNFASAGYEINLTLGILDVPQGGSFKYVATYISQSAYRSNEFHGVAGPVSGPESGNFGWNPVELAAGDYNIFVSIPADGTPAATFTPAGTEVSTTSTPEETPTSEPTQGAAPGAFNLLSPANGVTVRDNATVTSIIWSESAGAESYQFLLFKISNNTRVGVVLNVTVPTSVCSDSACVLSVDPATAALLDNGQYSWTVVASNANGETEAGNSPFLFTVNDVPVSYIVNGGFESKDNGGKPALAPWEGKALTGDKIKCNKEGKSFSYAGECAFQFKGSQTEASKLIQDLDPATIYTGDTLTLTLYVRTNIQPFGKLAVVKLNYANPLAGQNLDGVDKLQIVIPNSSTDYQFYTNSIPVADTVLKAKIQLRNRSGSGKLLVDEVSLVGAPASNVTPTPEPTLDVTATTEPGETPTEGPTETVNAPLPLP